MYIVGPETDKEDNSSQLFIKPATVILSMVACIIDCVLLGDLLPLAVIILRQTLDFTETPCNNGS